ncbi:MAG: sulfotransferase [Motiliproteus sp.]|nr:sulfotransferase [Motiliproteus sp.]MCW9051394.1 sulfotransferase [Motiliproteus sp.]
MDAGHAFFLKWIYPNAKILMLVRDPVNAYRSYAKFKRWYHIRPQAPVFTVHKFARHWKKTAASFLQHAEDLDAMIVRYEDLVKDPQILAQLQEYLGRDINPEVLQRKITNMESTPGGYRVVSGEIWLLNKIVAPVASELGYGTK